MTAKLNFLPRLAARTLLPLALCSFVPAVFAQAGADCVPDGNLAEVNACAVKRFQEADTAINIYYGDVMTALSAHERPLLRQDQKNWQRKRREYCQRRSRSHDSKPEWVQLYHECMTRFTTSRRTALSQWLHTGSQPPESDPAPLP